MGRVGEFTDYETFFTQLPAGIFVGAALFALAITVLVISSIFQIIFRKCCPEKKTTTTEIEEVVHVTNQETRRSFENPVYTQDVRENQKTREQDINVRISQAHGYLAIENHDYENAAHLKKASEEESDTEDYENLKDKNIVPPTKKQISERTETTESNEKIDQRRSRKTKREIQSDCDPIEKYDRPPKPKVKHVTQPNNSDDTDETPDYDVPKTFTDNSDDLPDYDVPKSFTG